VATSSAVATHLVPHADHVAAEVDLRPGQPEQLRQSEAQEESARDRDAIQVGRGAQQQLDLVAIEGPPAPGPGLRTFRRRQTVGGAAGNDAEANGSRSHIRLVDPRTVDLDDRHDAPSLGRSGDIHRQYCS
jgi:hypothetical protein